MPEAIRVIRVAQARVEAIRRRRTRPCSNLRPAVARSSSCSPLVLGCTACSGAHDPAGTP